VGLAILSIGTDLPEVFISIDAALMQLKGVELRESLLEIL
jgi:Ca2+/Na+ antiporter